MKTSFLRGGAVAIALLAFPAAALAQDEGSGEDNPFAPLPPGEGAEEVFYNCQACHSFRIVMQQNLSRRVWDEVLVWMVEKQGMHELPEDEREVILDYLTEHMGPESG